MAQPEPEEECSCDICQPLRDYHALSTEEKFRQAWPPFGRDELGRSSAYWRGYAESLEAENYDLLQQIRELEEDLRSEQARCSNCGRHK